MKRDWLSVAIVVGFGVALFLVIAGIGFFIDRTAHPYTPPPALSTVCDAYRMLDDARERDPFACGRGLVIVREHPEEELLKKKYVTACCNPPVKDLAGIVAKNCKEPQ